MAPWEQIHPTKRVNVRDGLTGSNAGADIDEKMADLIVALNRLGFSTIQCCQGDDKLERYIQFDMTDVMCEVDEDAHVHGAITLSVVGRDGDDCPVPQARADFTTAAPAVEGG